MAAPTLRSFLKFVTKTCPLPINPPPSPYSTTNADRPGTRKQREAKFQRSYSQPPKMVSKDIQRRQISKSMQSLRESEWQYDEPNENYEHHDTARSMAQHQQAIDHHHQHHHHHHEDAPSAFDESSVRYELEESTRAERRKGNVFDVLEYMMQQERSKSQRVFPHLQPRNLKSYGSNENMHFPMASRRYARIVYPSVTTSAPPAPRVMDKPTDISSYFHQAKEHADQEMSVADQHGADRYHGRLTLGDRPSQHFRKMYSTTTCAAAAGRCAKLLAGPQRSSKVSLLTGKVFASRKSSTALLRSSKSRKLSVTGTPKDFVPSALQRYYNTPAPACKEGEYVHVKLGDLTKCRQAKKINFGKLPKLRPPDCPCIEDLPLKEGKPLGPIKRRSEPKHVRPDCYKNPCPTPRADANLKIKPKVLPRIQVYDCPCEERVMTDLKIRRLPKKKVREPPRQCPPCQVEGECCPPRADANLKPKSKCLPKLKVNTCPCVEDIELKDMPLRRMKPRKVQQRIKECPVPTCPPRADDNLKIKPKMLPVLKPRCICIEAPEILPTPPLPRMRRIKFVEPPRGPCHIDPCDEIVRADADKPPKQKKLKKFVPKQCPCVEEDLPGTEVKLRRLEVKYPPKEHDNACPPLDVCPPRADEGMVIKPKTLPQIEAKDCPCIIEEMKDMKPLKRLVPIPVVPPPRICPCPEPCCPPPRVIKVAPKTLPKLKAGNCPCVEPEPLKDCPPLKNLKPRPVKNPSNDCQRWECAMQERADDGLKVEQKQLRKLSVGDCPCIEAEPPEDVEPLRRPPRMEVKEPPRIPPVDECEETPRADENDWMYWNKCEVKAAATCPPDDGGQGKRSYSTKTCRAIRGLQSRLQLKYQVSSYSTHGESGVVPLALSNCPPRDRVIDLDDTPPKIFTHQTLEALTDDTPLEEHCKDKNAINPIDYIAYAVCRDHLGLTTASSSCSTLKSLESKSRHKIASYTDVTALFNTINRMISTYNIPHEKKCIGECPRTDHLQPKTPFIKQKESFLVQYPDETVIDMAAYKSSRYERVRKPSSRTSCEHQLQEVKDEALCEIQENLECLNKVSKEDRCEKKVGTRASLWERVVNYFKARPDCPGPEEFKKLRLKEDAEKAASKAGLCLYDPKEMLKKTEREMPKVITAGVCKQECKK